MAQNGLTQRHGHLTERPLACARSQVRADGELSVAMEYEQWHTLESLYLRYLAEEIDRPLLIAWLCNVVPGGRTKLQSLVVFG